jgi:transposase-like protein
MTDFGLSTKQIAVIDALSSGVTFTAAAEQVGVHRNTIAAWRRNHLPFQHALSHAQYDRALLYREKTEELADLAVAALRTILSNPNTSPSILLRAALAIIKTVSTPPEAKKQVQLDIEKIVTHPADPHNITAESLDGNNMPGHAEPAGKPEDCTVVQPGKTHSFAQSPTRKVGWAPTPPVATIHREGPKIGRNEPCPCGSGLKFKRCCLLKQRSVEASSPSEMLAQAA